MFSSDLSLSLSFSLSLSLSLFLSFSLSRTPSFVYLSPSPSLVLSLSLSRSLLGERGRRRGEQQEQQDAAGAAGAAGSGAAGGTSLQRGVNGGGGGMLPSLSLFAHAYTASHIKYPGANVIRRISNHHIGTRVFHIKKNAPNRFLGACYCYLVNFPVLSLALPAAEVGLQIQCGVNFFILDSRRVLAPAPKVCWGQHTSQTQILRHFERKGSVYFIYYYYLRLTDQVAFGAFQHALAWIATRDTRSI